MAEPILITDENIIDIQKRSIQNVYGRVLIDAYGTGYALVQVREREKEKIELRIKFYFIDERGS
jgi:hypothetical protein